MILEKLENTRLHTAENTFIFAKFNTVNPVANSSKFIRNNHKFHSNMALDHTFVYMRSNIK